MPWTLHDLQSRRWTTHSTGARLCRGDTGGHTLLCLAVRLRGRGGYCGLRRACRSFAPRCSYNRSLSTRRGRYDLYPCRCECCFLFCCQLHLCGHKPHGMLRHLRAALALPLADTQMDGVHRRLCIIPSVSPLTARGLLRWWCVGEERGSGGVGGHEERPLPWGESRSSGCR